MIVIIVNNNVFNNVTQKFDEKITQKRWKE